MTYRIPIEKRQARESRPDGRVYKLTGSYYFERSKRLQRRIGNLAVFAAVVAWCALLGFCIGRFQ